MLVNLYEPCYRMGISERTIHHWERRNKIKLLRLPNHQLRVSTTELQGLTGEEVKEALQ